MLNQAIYVSATDKIYGTMGPYIVKYNADTGAREAVAKVTSPAEGPCYLVYHAATGVIYVSVWNAQVGANSDGTTVSSLYRDIFPVNPVSLAVGSGLGIYAAMQFATPSYMDFEGPHSLMSSGSTLWFDWMASGGTHSYVRVDPTAIPAFIAGTDKFVADLRFTVGQFSSDGTNITYAKPFSNEIVYFNMVGVMAIAGVCAITPGDQGVLMPMAVEYCPSNSKVYAVCGGELLMRVNSWGASDYDKLNLSSLVTAGCDPFHIRYRSANSSLYIPCQGNDTVLVWNPVADPGMGAVSVKTGFDGPIDVVFTASKAFAVQSGIHSLREIT